ncbi:MAG: tetratricopeptide repeat protein [Candidatus Thorarchaeota archaeon]|nr:MAG: hypothetical protein DRP09_02145 [Candidatus Thorarchaeota archaeon]RLI60086.1 MAG: hypothetical protein DRO87_00800 [Candidatus Thorarchaeota archaeon]
MSSEQEESLDDMDPAEILEGAAKALKEGDKEMAAKLFNAAGNIYMSVAEYEEAHECFEKALNVYKGLDDPSGTTVALYNLGVSQINLERWPEAMQTLSSAMKLFEKASNDSGVADAIYGLALATLGSGDFEGAITHFKKAQRIYRKLGNRQGEAIVLMDMGQAYLDKEDSAAAETTIKKALKIFREIEDKAGIADALSVIGDIAENNGNDKKSAEMFVEAAQNYYEAEIFDIAKEVVERAEQKMWDVPKTTRRRLRKLIDALIDALPDDIGTPSDDEFDDDELLNIE